MRMNKKLRAVIRDRRGIAAMMFGLLLPVLIGFVALSVDTAMLSAGRAQLSTAADSAALAAARQVANEFRLRGTTDLTSTISAANAAAVTFAGNNRVFGQAVTLVSNTSNSANGDILVGYKNPSLPTVPFTTAVATTLYNSVRVNAQRSASRGGNLPTFFSSLMGFTGSSMSVQSTGTVMNYAIQGFTRNNGRSANLLPIVLDIVTYNAMMAGTTTDQYTWNPTTQTVTSGPDGVEESQLYPVASGNPGNWGTIKVGVSNNSTSTLGDQIRYGITDAQLSTFPGGVISLDTSLSPPSITFGGNPGISAGIKDDLTSIIGNPVTIPIYDQTGGNGNNAWYRVIAFAGVRILSVNFQGNPKYVIIQPALVEDNMAIRGAPQASWTQGGLVVLHLSE